MSTSNFDEEWLLKLPLAQKEFLRGMMLACRFEKKSQLANSAFTLFGWCIAELQSGRVIGSVNLSTMEFHSVAMPGWEHVAPNPGNGNDPNSKVTVKPHLRLVPPSK